MALRTRLLVAVGLVTLFALGATGIATHALLRSFLYTRVDQSLDASEHRLGFAIDRGFIISSCAVPRAPLIPPQGTGAPSLNSFQIAFFEIRTPQGLIVDGQRCPAYIGTHPFTPSLPASITGLVNGDGPGAVYFTANSNEPGGPRFRVRASNLSQGNQLIVAVPLTDVDDTLHNLVVIELLVATFALIAALGVGFALVRIGLRPLTDIEHTATTISDSDLASRIPGANDRTEVGRLAATLNVMLGRIEAAFALRDQTEAALHARDEQLRTFIADASHELRTPIAAISAYAELFEHGASQHPDDLARLLSGISNESARLEQLVSDLLTLARLDEGIEPVHLPVELVSVATEAIATAHAVSPQWQVSFEAAAPAEVIADRSQLLRVVENLLRNVRTHTQPGTVTRVAVSTSNQWVSLVVEDNGAGMDPQTAARAFDRFTRGDPSRDRARGGNGIGLSIVKAIVTNHGGEVFLDSTIGVGTTVSVRLPASLISQS